ncbi:hypothetical protein T439DRAFT_364560 [Meredithblackwellia eburnea MCA 4105]
MHQISPPSTLAGSLIFGSTTSGQGHLGQILMRSLPFLAARWLRKYGTQANCGVGRWRSLELLQDGTIARPGATQEGRIAQSSLRWRTKSHLRCQRKSTLAAHDNNSQGFFFGFRGHPQEMSMLESNQFLHVYTLCRKQPSVRPR